MFSGLHAILKVKPLHDCEGGIKKLQQGNKILAEVFYSSSTYRHTKTTRRLKQNVKTF